MAEHHREFPYAHSCKRFADEGGMGHCDVSVVNDGFITIHNGVAGNA